jgi:hypothetical protein
VSDAIKCRACDSRAGTIVLDLGEQPPADFFPERGEPGPDPVYPLQMWLCADCGLAQLAVDPTLPEEPRAQEPAALAAQAADAVANVTNAGFIHAGERVAEYESPHGGSWLRLLAERGLAPVRATDQADVVVDCFGMMHAADQGAALRRRAERVAPGGTLLLQYHSLATIVRRGQWNALRHGHFAYYSTPALTTMLATAGFQPRQAWTYPLYGGTVMLAASRIADDHPPADASVAAVLDDELAAGVEDAEVVAGLQRAMVAHAEQLHAWLTAARAAGRTVVGYGAASRAVALLVHAGVDPTLLPAVVDASAAKVGRRMPGTDIPVVAPTALAEQRPDAVLLFVPDLLDEVRAAYPEVEGSGGRWVDAEILG